MSEACLTCRSRGWIVEEDTRLARCLLGTLELANASLQECDVLFEALCYRTALDVRILTVLRTGRPSALIADGACAVASL